MNVQELTALLEDADPDAEVLIVSQPSWRLRFTVAGVYDASDHAQPCDPHDACECSECDSPPEDLNVDVVTGDHPYDGSPYGPWDACDAARTS